jgi:hypothetical protein
MSKQCSGKVVECQEEVVVRQDESVFKLTVESLALAISSSFLEGCVEYV